jgi:quercetin dioxygenase-like cupin family protein
MKKSLKAAGVLAIALTTAISSAQVVVPKFDHMIPNIPGKSLIAVQVTFPPDATSVPHHHAKSAFVFAYVISGTIRSQVEGEPMHDYHTGESWYENPGAHHVVAKNLSKTETAKLLAVFVVDSNSGTLTTPDR